MVLLKSEQRYAGVQRARQGDQDTGIQFNSSSEKDFKMIKTNWNQVFHSVDYVQESYKKTMLLTEGRFINYPLIVPRRARKTFIYVNVSLYVCPCQLFL